MTIGKEAMDVLIQTYRDKALDTFIRGLRGDLSKLLCIREPNSLPQALHLCLKLQNQNFRTEHALNKNTKSNSKNTNYRQQTIPAFFAQPTSVIQRNNQHAVQYQNQYPTQYPSHYPNHYPNPYYQHIYPDNKQFQNTAQFQNFQRQNHNAFQIPPSRPNAPKPIPMEIDQSMQTRNVNYINRPRPDDRFMGKIPPQPSVLQKQKMQRNYNIQTCNNEVDQEVHYNQQMESYESENNLQPLDEYSNQNDFYATDYEPESTSEQDLTDIHFLE